MEYMNRSMGLNLPKHQPVKLLPASTHLPVVRAAPISDARMIELLHQRTKRLLRQGDVMGAIATSRAMAEAELRSRPVKLLPRYR
jgi:hypothetical protein